jgi:transposase
MHLEFLLLDHEQLRLESYSLEPGLLNLHVRATQLSCECPDCHTVSSRVYSEYQRELADLPCGILQLRLAWIVRRFFCDNSECERTTFV